MMNVVYDILPLLSNRQFIAFAVGVICLTWFGVLFYEAGEKYHPNDRRHPRNKNKQIPLHEDGKRNLQNKREHSCRK